MYNYIVQQRDLDILRQGERTTFSKVDLLNHDYKTIDSLEGVILSDNFSCNSESVVRRSYSCEISVTNSTFSIGKDKKIWIDKYIRVYYGVEHIRSNEIIWYLIGTFSFVEMNYKFSGTESTLSLSCMDLMANYDGTKNGELLDKQLKVLAGENMRLSIIGLLEDAGISNYMVEDMQYEIPYDIEWTAGTTYSQALTDLCSLYDSWEFFFDADGIFIWRKIPTGYEDPIILDDSILHELFLDVAISDSFKNVYNATAVWGKSLSLENDDRYANSSNYQGNVYHITFDGISSMDDMDNFTKIAIRINSNNNLGASICINNIENIPIINDDGTAINGNRLEAGKDYVFKYRRTLNGETKRNFYILGQYQAYGYYEEHNKECPYSVENIGYKIVHCINRDDLYSDDLCYNQAEFETYKTTAKQDSLTINCVIIPFLEPNQKIKFTPYFGETAQYIIKNFSWNTSSGSMTINLYRFLEDFSYVKKQTKKEVVHGNMV